MTQLETQKQMCEILMPSRGFDAVMKTSCRINGSKTRWGGDLKCSRSSSNHHHLFYRAEAAARTFPTTTFCSRSTMHHLSGQVHINQKPTCLSVDAENDISPVGGLSFHQILLAPKDLCSAAQYTPGQSGSCQCKLTQFRTSRTGKQLRRAGRTSETVVVEGPV